MVRTFLRFLVPAMLTAGLVSAYGDDIKVIGKVADGAGKAITNARVTVTVGYGQTAKEGWDSTDANGAYQVALTYAPGGVGFGGALLTISASAAQHRPAQVRALVQNVNDNKADTVKQDLVLEANGTTPRENLDTVTVKGVVVNSAGRTAISGAQVIISSVAALGGRLASDTGASDVSGAFSVRAIVNSSLPYVSWRVNAAGYQSAEGTAQVARDGVARLDTIRLVALTADDSLRYQVQGTITDDKGAGVSGATVIVTLARGTTQIFIDTVQTSNFGGVGRGVYQAQTRRIPYVAGDITVTVAVKAPRYVAKTETLTVPSSTAQITVNVKLVPDGGVAVLRPVSGVSARSVVQTQPFVLNGRILATQPRHVPVQAAVVQSRQRVARSTVLQAR